MMKRRGGGFYNNGSLVVAMMVDTGRFLASREPHRPPPALPPAAVKAHKRKSGARRCFIVMSGSGVQRLAVNQHS
jgi:hypothetical protein